METKPAVLHPSIPIPQDTAETLESTPPSYHPLHPVSSLSEPWDPSGLFADSFRSQKQRGNGHNSEKQVSEGEGSDHSIPGFIAGKFQNHFGSGVPGGRRGAVCAMVVCPCW